MPPETALIESRALRDSVVGRTEVLDKVKALALLPDGLHVTTQGVADYFAVHKDVIHKLRQRHTAELTENGLRTLRGSDLRRFEVDNLSTSNSSYPQGRAQLMLFTRRTVLNVAMLLRDSDTARRVRTYLLDAEEATRRQTVAPAGYVSMEQLWADAAVRIGERILAGPIGERFSAMEARQDNVEAHLHRVGSSLMELGPVLSRISTRVDAISTRLDGVELRLDSVYELVGAMSERISDLSVDMKAVKSRIGMTE
ncbi:hypothetical protein [Streptomyces sp. NBC_01262]|uniref:hypothetical protein n=1 Tax=Streptomyces sp. NBC_01262 TaxID=2903803 RepID=UPI002E34F74E|nr:hypothetical protein [Streptomyces sp. NBC_01262]